MSRWADFLRQSSEVYDSRYLSVQLWIECRWVNMSNVREFDAKFLKLWKQLPNFLILIILIIDYSDMTICHPSKMYSWYSSLLHKFSRSNAFK